MTLMTHKVHFTAMSGSYGCIPDNIAAFEKRIDAVYYLIDIFELPRYGSKAGDLRKTGYVELGHDFGADYAEIEECNCSHHEIHGEGSKEEVVRDDNLG
jgi:hypothetical protein